MAARDLGIDLGRLALLPHPGAAWAEATAAVLEGVDLVVLCPPFPPRRAMARRLAARARERRGVLVVVPGRAGWPEPADLQLRITDPTWEGADAGEGHLHRRRVTVTATGRRSAVRPVRRGCGCPTPTDGCPRPGPSGRRAEVDRLLVVRCPELLIEDEGGAELRALAEVVTAVEAYCPWVTPVRPGICSLPARGPARYFGGEEALVDRVRVAASSVTPAEVGIADGLFAAVLAARHGAGRPRRGHPGVPGTAPGGHPRPGRPGRDCSTAWGSAPWASSPRSPTPTSSAASGPTGPTPTGWPAAAAASWPTSASPGTARRLGGGAPDGPVVAEPGFWGGASDADARAARCLAVAQELLGPDGVVTAHLQGGAARPSGPASSPGPTTVGRRAPSPTDVAVRSPPRGPGRIPPPAPAVVHPDPVRAELADTRGEPVRVSARGLLTTAPDRLSVEGGPWEPVSDWAGPWPADERWWSRSRRRAARLQAVTARSAHLLLVERGRWWVEATYG